MAGKIVICGGDSLAAEWAARFLLRGFDVVLCGHSAAIRADLDHQLALARRFGAAIHDAAPGPEGRVSFSPDFKAASQGADLALISGNPDPVQPGDVPALRFAGDKPQIRAVSPVWLLPAVCFANDVNNALYGIEDTLQKAGMQRLDTAGFSAVAALADAVQGLAETDRCAALAGLLRSLRDRGFGIGAWLLQDDRARLAQAADAPAGPAGPDGSGQADDGQSLALEVLPAWLDYNGHMTESRYLYACSEITDAFLRRIGAGLDYVATGRSYYTAETHLRHLREAKSGDRLRGHVQVLSAESRKLHLLIRISRGDTLLATLEQLLVHVDMRAARGADADPAVLARAQAIADRQRALARPDFLGRGITLQRRAAKSGDI